MMRHRWVLAAVLCGLAMQMQSQAPISDKPLREGTVRNTRWGKSAVPKGGFVPDEKTATALAEVVLNSIYRQEHVKAERPYSAKLEGDVWVVRGTSRFNQGGAAVLRIAKSDGRILFFIHEQ